MKIVIIEDEKLTARDLANTIKAIEPDAEIVSFLYSVEDAVLYFQLNPKVDLIFSDIELGDGLTFEIFKRIDIQVPIVFCTAYQQYMLEAFQTLGIDYVLKPFNKQSIERTFLKYKNLKSQFSKPNVNFDNLITQLKENQPNREQSVITHQGDKVVPLGADEIAFFFIEDDYTFAYTFDKRKILINQRMDKLEAKFNSFFRANRQFLVNRRAVKDASQYFNRKMVINLTVSFPEKIIVGKLKVTEFIKWLETY